MYNNKRYYLDQIRKARADAADSLSEAGPDFLHVVLDALRHLEGAIEEGFTPWKDYGEPMNCYRVTAVSGEYKDIWKESLSEAAKKFYEDFPALEIASVVRQI